MSETESLANLAQLHRRWYALGEISWNIPVAMISERQSTADLGKNGQDEEKEAFLSVPLTNDHVPPSTKEAARRSAIRYARLALEVLMATAIVILLARSGNDGQVSTSKTELSPVPTCKPSSVMFSGGP